jgi:hypothetical protein
MIASAQSFSEADILAQVVAPDEPSLHREFARTILDLRFRDEAQATIRDLLDKGNRGTISDAERGLLDKYLRVGQFIDLLQAKARLTLRDSSPGE